MFNVPDGTIGATWSYTTAGRGKRVVDVATGCYVVEHIPTGKCIVGVSQHVSSDVDRHIQALWALNHTCKAFNKLCNLDPDLKLFEYPTRTLRLAKQLERNIRETMYPTYLLLN